MAKYKEGKEILLYGVADEIRVPEIRVRYNRGKKLPKINDSQGTYNFFKQVIGMDISVQEHMVVLFLDNSLNILGYYKHTIGTPTASLIDIPMILGVALKVLARNIIIGHNHPSNTSRPSESDRQLTKEMADAAKTIKLKVLDHIIITKDNGYYSFADSDHVLEGIGSNLVSIEQQLRKEIFEQLSSVTSINAPNVYRMIQTESGYRNIEQRIINLVIWDRITPSACIPQIENEL